MNLGGIRAAGGRSEVGGQHDVVVHGDVAGVVDRAVVPASELEANLRDSVDLDLGVGLVFAAATDGTHSLVVREEIQSEEVRQRQSSDDVAFSANHLIAFLAVSYHRNHVFSVGLETGQGVAAIGQAGNGLNGFGSFYVVYFDTP